jgi:hypothetical protein
MASVKAAEYVAFKAEGIWRYFLRLKVNDQFGNKAKCTECNKVYACTGGSTKGLHDHVLSMHAIDVRARKRPAEAVDTPTSPSNASSSSSQIPEKMSRGPRGPLSKFILPNIEKSLQKPLWLAWWYAMVFLSEFLSRRLTFGRDSKHRDFRLYQSLQKR